MAEFFGSVLFIRIMVAVFMVAVAGLVATGVVSAVNKKKNKQKSKALSNTKAEKEVKTEKEEEQEVEQTADQLKVAEEEIAGVSEFEYNGVKYVKYKYGASECVCKPENSSKWITFAQSLQNSGKLEQSKEVADHTLIVNKENNLECFLTGNKEELEIIEQNNLNEYNTEIRQNNKVAQAKQQTEVEEVKEVEA